MLSIQTVSMILKSTRGRYGWLDQWEFCVLPRRNSLAAMVFRKDTFQPGMDLPKQSIQPVIHVLIQKADCIFAVMRVSLF